MKNQKGFSLIELLIVVIIIAIIAVIAIPNLLASRRSANEAGAIATERTLHSANATYKSSAGAGLYAVNMAALGTAELIDPVLAGATTAATAKTGYFYTYAPLNTATDPTSFTIIATPSSEAAITATGTRRFFVDETGVVRAEPAGTAPTNASPALNP